MLNQIMIGSGGVSEITDRPDVVARLIPQALEGRIMRVRFVAALA